MKKTQLRTFMVDEKEVVFNQKYFNELFMKHASKKSVGIGVYEYEVAEALYVDKSAVHNWRMGVNGPGDIEKIQSLAKLWNIKYEVLLMEVKTMSTTTKEKGLTDREKIALKNVYSSFLNYMTVFENTVGFIWNEDNTTGFNMLIAYDLYEKTKKALEVEYIDLKATVYDDLKEFYNKELTYTLEAYYSEEEGDCPEVQMAETTALHDELIGKFKTIIDPYLV